MEAHHERPLRQGQCRSTIIVIGYASMIIWRVWTATAGLIFTTLNFSASQVHAAATLPFSDGTYVTDTVLCGMSAVAIGEKYGDRVGMMTYNIRGNRLDNGYEMYCEIENVRTSGKKIRFDLYCETEGETDTSTETWAIVDKKSFKVGKRLYTACGRFLD